MDIRRIELGGFMTNCYLVSGGAPGEALLIDPADNGPELVAALEKLKLEPAAILLTHGHFDHMLAVPDLQARWPELPLYCHPLDVPESPVENYFGSSFPTVAAFQNIRPLAEGQQLALAGFTIKVLHTPGHTPGSVMFQMGDVLFTGDTLFQGSMGRTDFPGGSEAQMAQSLARLAEIQEDYRVLPGHMGESTLAAEQKTNPYLRRFHK